MNGISRSLVCFFTITNEKTACKVGSCSEPLRLQDLDLDGLAALWCYNSQQADTVHAFTATRIGSDKWSTDVVYTIPGVKIS